MKPETKLILCAVALGLGLALEAPALSILALMAGSYVLGTKR